MKQGENDTVYDVIRRNIKAFRKAKGWTSAQLAEAVGLSHDSKALEVSMDQLATPQS